MNKPKKWSRKKVFQFVALGLFLAGFPAVSWYYLSTGLDWRLKALQELKDHGQVPEFSLVDQNNKLINNEDLQGNVSVISFLPLKDEKLQQQFGENLRKLHIQFDERPDLKMLQFLTDTAQIAGELTKFTMDYELADKDQCYFFSNKENDFAHLATDGFKIPIDSPEKMDSYHYIALADTSQTIRKYYDVTKEEEVKRLVEHIAIILPTIKERDLVFQRESEK